MHGLKDGGPGSIAIVGGGFSGAMVAVQLGRLAGPRPPRVTLFEKGDRLARGVAYGTRSDAHLLNVPAGLMSALPDEPTHFLDWLRARDPGAHHGTFAPRRVYGDYLEGLLRDGPARVDAIRDEVIDLDVLDDRGGVRLTTRAGRVHTADRVVLALGHRPPADPVPWDGPAGAYVADPWSPGALEGLAPDDAVALIGSGLSAVDLAVELLSRGHRGTICAISRHGLIPCRHSASPPVPRPHFALPDPGAPATARAILSRVRSQAAACRSEGGDWRSVVDSIRPVAQALWGSLAVAERRRFARHVAPRWEVHRHRLAPAVDETIQAARRAGQLVVIAGRVLSLRGRGGSAAVRLLPRGAEGPEELLVRRAINCTGPARDIHAAPPGLLRSLLEKGLGRPGPLATGLDFAEDGTLIGRDGRTREQILAIGPLLKERLWETTAVREIRVQAFELARRLLSQPPA